MKSNPLTKECVLNTLKRAILLGSDNTANSRQKRLVFYPDTGSYVVFEEQYSRSCGKDLDQILEIYNSL